MSIKIENLTHIYMPKTPFEKKALDNINLVIEDGDFLALIGHIGSGKSTLIQHLNGLLEPSSGKILVDNVDITNKETKLTDIRKKIGLVFQYPEYQLFEETIEKVQKNSKIKRPEKKRQDYGLEPMEKFGTGHF